MLYLARVIEWKMVTGRLLYLDDNIQRYFVIRMFCKRRNDEFKECHMCFLFLLLFIVFISYISDPVLGMDNLYLDKLVNTSLNHFHQKHRLLLFGIPLSMNKDCRSIVYR